jgi:solute carrier family 35 protein E1
MNYKSHLKIASMHGLGNLASVVSFGAGSVSFAHVVKALEPVVAALLSILITGHVFSPMVYLSLLPIVIGVAFASYTEITFTWLGFSAAMLSNVFYQMRMVLAKEEFNQEKLNLIYSTLN